MHIEYLAYLSNLIQTHSISKTAQNFFVTQQAVSSAIKKMEREWNVQLVTRVKYGVELTPIGKSIAEDCRIIMDKYNEIADKIERDNIAKLNVLSGNLNIYVHPRIYQYVLFPVIKRFSEQCPYVKINIQEYQGNEIFQLISDSDQDSIGLLCLSGDKGKYKKILDEYFPNRFELTNLQSFQLFTCIGKNNVFKNKYGDNTEENILSSVTYSFDSDFILLNYDSPTVKKQEVAYQSNSATFHQQLVSNNMAIAYLTQYEYDFLWKDCGNYSLISTHKPWAVDFSVLTVLNANLLPQASYFCQLFERHLQDIFHYYKCSEL